MPCRELLVNAGRYLELPQIGLFCQGFQDLPPSLGRGRTRQGAVRRSSTRCCLGNYERINVDEAHGHRSRTNCAVEALGHSTNGSYALRMLRVATIVDDTEAEGPGRRFAVWVQGCSLRCPGCCNPEMFATRGGTELEISAIVDRLARVNVEGISVLGGEPFEQAADVAELARAVRARGLTVMIYSGYTIAELRKRAAIEPAVGTLLAETDLLVDGRYDRERPEPPPPAGRRWIGSTNQVMRYLTSAYTPDDPRMHAANTVEIHWRDGKLVVNGWPAGAAGLVRRS